MENDLIDLASALNDLPTEMLTKLVQMHAKARKDYDELSAKVLANEWQALGIVAPDGTTATIGASEAVLAIYVWLESTRKTAMVAEVILKGR